MVNKMFSFEITRTKFHREASTVPPFLSPRSDVAKLKGERRKSKKTTSTTHALKCLIINSYSNLHLYNAPPVEFYTMHTISLQDLYISLQPRL